MAKYLVQASYTAEGIKGLMKDKASGRRTSLEKTMAGLGGKLEAMYFAFGEHDVYLIFDCPDAPTAAAVSMAASASGLVRTKTTVLMSVEETDQAIGKTVNYRPPGA
jgi:uncharacterized protein with GYD domain